MRSIGRRFVTEPEKVYIAIYMSEWNVCFMQTWIKQPMRALLFLHDLVDVVSHVPTQDSGVRLSELLRP